MKNVLLILLSVISSLAWGETYLGCGLDLRQQGVLTDGVQHQHEHFALYHCHLDHHPALAEQGPILSLPSLSWQDSWDSNLPHHDQARYQRIGLLWPFWRYQELYFSIEANQTEHRQTQQVTQNTLWLASSNLLLAGQTMTFEQKEQHVGLRFERIDTRAPVTFISITNQRVQTPLAFMHQQQHWFAESEFSLWKIQIGRHSSDLGPQWQWSFAIAQGELTSSSVPEDQRPPMDKLVAADLKVGFSWRFRLGQHLHPYIRTSADARFWYFNEEGRDTKLDTPRQYSYQAGAGVDWRF